MAEKEPRYVYMCSVVVAAAAAAAAAVIAAAERYNHSGF